MGILIILCSCSSGKEYNEPQFVKKEEIRGECLSDDLMISYAYDMAVDDQYIYILASSQGKWVHVYDKSDGQYRGSHVLTGQGPGEVHTASSLTVDKDKLQIYDQSQMKLLTYSLKKQATVCRFLLWMMSVFFQQRHCPPSMAFADSLYLSDGQLGAENKKQKRFQLYDGHSVIYSYDDFPVQGEELEKVFLFPQICFSPSKDKMATGTLYGGILEIFHLSDSSISLSDVYRFYEPSVSFSSGDLIPKKDMKYGFSAMSATDDVIYSVLIGDSDPNKLNNISVFDWNGKGLIRYKTDKQIFKLSCYPGNPSELYALTFSPSEGFSLYLYRVKTNNGIQ